MDCIKFSHNNPFNYIINLDKAARYFEPFILSIYSILFYSVVY